MACRSRKGVPHIRQETSLAVRCALVAVCAALTWCAAPLLAAAAPAPRPLVFAGNGGSLGIIRVLAAAFTQQHPSVQIEVPPSLGSTGGIRAVAQGAVTVALTARPLEGAEQNLGLRAVPYGRTPIVLAAHAGLTENNLTDADVVAILQGTKTHWGNGQEIIVLLLRPDDTLPIVFGRAFPAMRDAYIPAWESRRWTNLPNEGDMNAQLGATAGTLGITTLGAILAERLPVKPFKLNGAAPDIRTRLAGRYPAWVTLHFVFRTNGLPPQAEAFMAFVRSAEGARILLANGVQPIE